MDEGMEDRLKEYNEKFTNDETEHEPSSADYEQAFEESLRLRKIKKEIERISLGEVSWTDPAEREATLRALLKESKAIKGWMNGIRNTCSEWDEALPVLLQSKSLRKRETEDVNTCDSIIQSADKFKKGGAPKSSLTEAVEHAYYKLLKNGNTRTIEPGKISEFLQYLKECVTEGNMNFSDYVAERIKEVKKVTGDCAIVMQTRTDKEFRDHRKTGKNKTFKKGDVSKILTGLRKKHKSLR